MLLSKIISGGQTGVDRGALEAALELGFDYGGLIPKGCRGMHGGDCATQGILLREGGIT